MLSNLGNKLQDIGGFLLVLSLAEKLFANAATTLTLQSFGAGLALFLTGTLLVRRSVLSDDDPAISDDDDAGEAVDDCNADDQALSSATIEETRGGSPPDRVDPTYVEDNDTRGDLWQADSTSSPSSDSQRCRSL